MNKDLQNNGQACLNFKWFVCIYICKLRDKVLSFVTTP